MEYWKLLHIKDSGYNIILKDNNSACEDQNRDTADKTCQKKKHTLGPAVLARHGKHPNKHVKWWKSLNELCRVIYKHEFGSQIMATVQNLR